jgi:hypothetical protein
MDFILVERELNSVVQLANFLLLRVTENYGLALTPLLRALDLLTFSLIEARIAVFYHSLIEARIDGFIDYRM